MVYLIFSPFQSVLATRMGSTRTAACRSTLPVRMATSITLSARAARLQRGVLCVRLPGRRQDLPRQRRGRRGGAPRQGRAGRPRRLPEAPGHPGPSHWYVAVIYMLLSLTPKQKLIIRYFQVPLTALVWPTVPIRQGARLPSRCARTVTRTTSSAPTGWSSTPRADTATTRTTADKLLNLQRAPRSPTRLLLPSPIPPVLQMVSNLLRFHDHNHPKFCK